MPRLTIEELSPVPRFSLRVRGENREALAGMLPLELPARIGLRAAGGGCETLCLGPDEWVVLCADHAREALLAASSAAYPQIPHSLCEISDREVTLRLSGAQVLDALASGCPREVAAIAVGQGRRTLFDSVTVILWRDEAHSFRMDMGRSFAPHIRALLRLVEAELNAGL